MTTLWFESKYHPESWYIGREIEHINKRLLATEFRHSLLFYSFTCLNGIFPRQNFHHFLLQGTYCLLKDTVTSHDIGMFFPEFVIRFEHLYGKYSWHDNVRMHIHLSETGDLCGLSALIFESCNGRLGKLFHGTQGVRGQIVEMFTIYQHIQRLLTITFNTESNQASKRFVEEMLRGYKLGQTNVKKVMYFY
jgi:hypothetical protein